VPWVLAMAATVFVTGLGVLTRRVTVSVAVPALLALQLLLHVGLTLVAPVHGPAADGMWHADVHGTGQPGPLLSWPMLFAHVAAAVVTAALWELGERAVDVVVACTDDGLPPSGHRGRPGTAGRSSDRPGREVLLAAPRRGPPAKIALL
jgi:hypothetical protein